MEGLNSNLNLNGRTPPRALPGLGEWGPEGVPSTRSKRRQRWIVAGLGVVVLAVVVLLEALLWQPLS